MNGQGPDDRPHGEAGTGEIAAFTARLRELSHAITTGTDQPGEYEAFLAERDALFGRLHAETPRSTTTGLDSSENAEDYAMTTNDLVTHDAGPHAAADRAGPAAASLPGLRSMSSAALLASAEHADNMTYLGDAAQKETAYRELEAIEAEASRRAEGAPLSAHTALADYVGLLIEDPGADRFDEFTQAYNAAHHALGVAATPPPVEATAAEPADRPTDQAGSLAERLAAIDVEAAQDRSDRADPGLAPLLNARDHQAAGGRFELADSTQAIIDATRERPPGPTGEDRSAARSADRGAELVALMAEPDPVADAAQRAAAIEHAQGSDSPAAVAAWAEHSRLFDLVESSELPDSTSERRGTNGEPEAWELGPDAAHWTAADIPLQRHTPVGGRGPAVSWTDDETAVPDTQDDEPSQIVANDHTTDPPSANDPAEIAQRIDAARAACDAALAANRDPALTAGTNDRREQLARWHTDDHGHSGGSHHTDDRDDARVSAPNSSTDECGSWS